VWENSLGKIVLSAPNTTSNAADRTMHGSVPISWANGDILFVSGQYEAA
jgi:hypothetical protein